MRFEDVVNFACKGHSKKGPGSTGRQAKPRMHALGDRDFKNGVDVCPENGAAHVVFERISTMGEPTSQNAACSNTIVVPIRSGPSVDERSDD